MLPQNVSATSTAKHNWKRKGFHIVRPTVTYCLLENGGAATAMNILTVNSFREHRVAHVKEMVTTRMSYLAPYALQYSWRFSTKRSDWTFSRKGSLEVFIMKDIPYDKNYIIRLFERGRYCHQCFYVPLHFRSSKSMSLWILLYGAASYAKNWFKLDIAVRNIFYFRR